MPTPGSTHSAAARTARVAALAVGLLAALPAVAGAQSAFQAVVSATNPKPAPCANGDFICGTADTTAGPASWGFALTGLDVLGICDSYSATVTFTLADGSALVLDESGLVCGPGGSALSNASPDHSFGHPSYVNGSWTVQSADGQFAGMTGSGTDTFHAAGAQASGSYTAAQ